VTSAISVVITGANGQLGQALQRFAPANLRILACTRNDLDITEESAVRSAIEAIKPDVIINAAAYTAVDKAESEQEQAARVNSTGPRNLAAVLQVVGRGRLIHVSTDFVFDGQSSVPYSTDAATHPLSVYGQTKRDGEASVQDILGQRTLVVRTAWLYSSSGKNFVLTMLRLMQDRGEVRVVADQIGTPTSINSLATTLWRCVASPELYGVYHWTDAGVASWYDFAVAIAEEAFALKLLDKMPIVLPIPTVAYPTPATRPAYSVLDKSRAYEDLQTLPVHWRQELRQVLGELVNA